MAVLVSGPFKIFPDHALKPLAKLRPGILAAKPLDLLRFQTAVGELDPALLQLMIAAVKIAVAHRLRQMEGKGFRKPGHIRVHSFDLINIPLAVLLKDPVSPSLHQKRQPLLGLRLLMAQKNLRLIPDSHPLLDLPVDPAARQHRILLRAAKAPVVQIPGPKNKFYKIPDGNTAGLLL